MRVDVWIDGDSLLRRVRCMHRGRHATVEFDDFGGPPPIELPPPELCIDWDEGLGLDEARRAWAEVDFSGPESSD
jgi:hypothetical protein